MPLWERYAMPRGRASDGVACPPSLEERCSKSRGKAMVWPQSVDEKYYKSWGAFNAAVEKICYAPGQRP